MTSGEAGLEPGFDRARAETLVLKQADDLARMAGWQVVDCILVCHRTATTIRIFLDKPGGVSVADCGTFSADLDPFLEELFAEAGNYTVEVSSPGIDRVLKKEREYRWAVGKTVRVTVQRGATRGDGKTVMYRGKLEQYTNNPAGPGADVFTLGDAAYGRVELSGSEIRLIKLDAEPRPRAG